MLRLLLVFRPVFLIFRFQFDFRRFNLFYRCQAPLDNSRFVWDCKGSDLF